MSTQNTTRSRFHTKHSRLNPNLKLRFLCRCFSRMNTCTSTQADQFTSVGVVATASQETSHRTCPVKYSSSMPYMHAKMMPTS